MARKDINAAAAPEPDNAVLSEMEGHEPGTELAVSNTMALGEVTGEVDPGQIRLPRLQITYGVGSLAENFHPGDLVLGGDNLIAEKEKPVLLVILTAHQYWKEYLSREQYAAKIRPRTFNTAAEVHKAGGTTQWVKHADGTSTGPSFSLAMDLKMLIQKPEGLVCGLFGIPIGGKEYAPAIWSLDKTAYKRVGPTVLTTQQFSLRARGLFSGLFELSTAMEKVNSNVTPTPKLRLHSHLPDEAVAEIKSLFGQVAQAPVEGDAPQPA